MSETNLFFKRKDSNEWKKLDGVKSISHIDRELGLPIRNFVNEPITLTGICQLSPMTRIIIQKMRCYQTKAGIITRELSERCKRCGRVRFIVDKEKKEIRPICEDICTYLKLGQQQIQELYKKCEQEINEIVKVNNPNNENE